MDLDRRLERLCDRVTLVRGAGRPRCGELCVIPDPADRLSKADRPPPCAVIAVALINRIPYHCPFPAPMASATSRRDDENGR